MTAATEIVGTDSTVKPDGRNALALEVLARAGARADWTASAPAWEVDAIVSARSTDAELTSSVTADVATPAASAKAVTIRRLTLVV